MRVTYAVSWTEPNGSPGSGRLELGTDALMLEGQNGSAPIRRVFPYRNMSGFRIARGAGERLQGRPTLIVDLVNGGSLRIAGVAQPGIVSELASRLSAIQQDGPLSQRLAVVLPLKPGAKPKAESLLAKGPPFDPAAMGLDEHEVFLTEHEVVFVFEGPPSLLLDRTAANETIWDAAGVWEPLVEGSVRFAERVYAWPS